MSENQIDVPKRKNTTAKQKTSQPAQKHPEKEQNKEILGPLTLIKKSLKTFRKHFFPIFGIYFLAFIFQILFASLPFEKLIVTSIKRSLTTFKFQNLLLTSSIIIIFGLVLSFIHIWGQLAIMLTVRYKDEKLGVLQTLAAALPKILPFILTSLLAALTVAGGFVGLIIPGILFSIWFILIPMVVIFDDLKTFPALLKSKLYIKKTFWKVLLRYLCLGIFLFLFWVFVGMIQDLLNTAINTNLKLLAKILKNLATLLITPFTYIYLSHLFLSVKKSTTIEIDVQEKNALVYKIFAIIGALLFIAIPLLAFNHLKNLDVPTSKIEKEINSQLNKQENQSLNLD